MTLLLSLALSLGFVLFFASVVIRLTTSCPPCRMGMMWVVAMIAYAVWDEITNRHDRGNDV